MPNFVVMARKEWGEKCKPYLNVRGSEQRAIDIAQKLHKDAGMNRTLVLGDGFKIIFKVDRRCKCMNAQYNIFGELKCEDCGRVINNNGFKVEEYQ